MADIPNDPTTTAVIATSGLYMSELEISGDSDWWRVDMTAGMTYTFRLSGDGSLDTLRNAALVLRDADGTLIRSQQLRDGNPVTWSFTATTDGTYYVDIRDNWNDDAAEGNYRILAQVEDVVVNDATTTLSLGGDIVTGTIDGSYDSDWYRVTLTAGHSVEIMLSGDGGLNGMLSGTLRLVDESGNAVARATTNPNGQVNLTYTPLVTGTYFIDVGGRAFADLQSADYVITPLLSDNVANNTATTQLLQDGSKLGGVIDAFGDQDWIRFEAVAGRTYTLRLSGDGSLNELANQHLALRDQNGVLITSDRSDDDAYATLTFTATRSGSYFIEAAGYAPGVTQRAVAVGNYELSVISDSPLLRGTTGADSLTGGANDNRIVGLGGNDTLDGGAGNDRLLGGFGHDLLIGGDGIDTADYDGSIAVRVSLGITGPQVTGHGTDILRGIENLAGGQLGDWLMGNAGANVLEGRGGNDTLNGGAGNDRLFGGLGDDQMAGGEGNDTVVYTSAGTVVVDLGTGRASGAEGNDTLAGIENVTTGAGNDVLRGNVLANVLNGGAGNDNLTGGAGNDRLFGGAGADRFVFGKGDGGDVIADFQDGLDRIVMTTAADSMADLRITAGANGAVVWYDGGNIVLNNIAVNQLSAADFIFE